MARGFESKDVEFQQAEAERTSRVFEPPTPAERVRQVEEETLRLSLRRMEADLARANHPAHRKMIEEAIAALKSRLVVALLILATSLSMFGCGSREDVPASAPGATPPPVTHDTQTVGTKPRIVVLGDSLTAGLGLAPEQAYPRLLQQRLDTEGLKYEVVNAGVSGDTSAGGLSRLEWALEGDVQVLIVALGGNDALRGLPVEELTRNLSAIIERAQKRKIQVIVAGMEAPPNFGQAYTVSFHNVYPDLVTKYHVAFVPFLLQGVAGIESLNQRDGIHPTVEGARVVAENVWSVLRPLLKTS